MDLSSDFGTLHSHNIVGGAGPQLVSPCQTESGATILLQLLEFKNHLIDAVEELHIRRDAETRFENQISKLMLEKQELEWEKESLQHQIKTVSNQHTESLTDVKKQLQAKIRKIEEEKGKYQVSAELKNKEINNLKEELKSLQLLKYNLEKKSSELEQKLALQSRSKDSHLNQLGEVEKRFSALSRQCAMVKKAHEILEQNVDEAKRINNKLTSANAKQEATIASLKKEVEEVSNKLVKAKMSSVQHDKSQSPTGRDQHVQQLCQKLNMETEMNKKLRDEYVAVRAEKQEVMKSLQHTQQLLLSQTQTVSRIDLELQRQREQYQALKQEHEVMWEKSRAKEDKVAQLMESYAAAKTIWDKEKTMFVEHIERDKRDHQTVKEAYDKLQQKHTELSLQAEGQAQTLHELEMRGSSQGLSVSTEQQTRGVRPFNEPSPSSELPSSGSLRHLALSPTKTSVCLEDRRAVTELVDTGAVGGQEAPNHHLQSQCEEFRHKPHISNPVTCPSNICCLYSIPGIISSDDTNVYMNKSNTGERDFDVVSDAMRTTSSVSDDDLLMNKGSMTMESSPDHRSKDKNDEGNKGTSETEQGGKGGEEKRNKVQQLNTEMVRGEDVEGGHAEGKSGTLMTQTTDRVDRKECGGGGTRKHKTETKDRAEGGNTPETPEPEIPTQTAGDKKHKFGEKTNVPLVNDFVINTETPLLGCEPPDSSKSPFQKDGDSGHVNKRDGSGREEQLPYSNSSDKSQCVNHGPNPLDVEVQQPCRDAESSAVHKDSKNNIEGRLFDKYVADFPAELFECSSQTVTVQSGGIVNNQDLRTNQTQIQPSNLPDISSNINPTVELCDKKLSEEGALVRTMVDPELRQSQGPSEQENGQLKSLVLDSVTSHKSEGRTNVSNACETANGTMETSNLKDPCDNVDSIIVELKTGSCREQFKNDGKDVEDRPKTESEADLKLSVQHHIGDASPEADNSKCHEKPVTETLLDDSDVSPLPSNKIFRSSFDWGSAQRRPTTSVSFLHHCAQNPHVEQRASGSGGFFGHPPSAMPMFLESKHNRVPVVITSASDLLNASSVSGTAASTRRHQQGEWKAVTETTAADTESRDSLSINSFPASTSSSDLSRLSWQTTSGCSRTSLGAGPGSESDIGPSCSLEREEQQASFRNQIYKIEQFLNTERLRLPKRQRTDN